ncbi:MAG: bacillithiol system redox-active protein YtxJ [Crocinitomicaceae bacterium]|nr:bacillithiol system redox-active protein YtxJ [Crocinitomicaceae bacterium]
MFWKKKEDGNAFPWEDLQEVGQLEDIIELSKEKPVLIFKHSTRCSISFMAKSRFEGGYEDMGMSIWLLDLIKNRSISNQIAEDFGIKHESPQVLLIKEGKCIYSASHNAIEFRSVKQNL